MSHGKYSPNLPRKEETDFCFNAKGQTPVEYVLGSKYDEETMFGDYDSEGFDRYGYSAYKEDGTFVGIGQGIDRNGYTEFEYLMMSDEEFRDF